jgi:hypothetical protein
MNCQQAQFLSNIKYIIIFSHVSNSFGYYQYPPYLFVFIAGAYVIRRELLCLKYNKTLCRMKLVGNNNPEYLSTIVGIVVSIL